jgi:hypothetical protein
MGLYETQNRLGQSETLMLFFSKNKFQVHLVGELQQLGVPSGVPIRDLMGSHNWRGLQACSSFYKKCGVTV